ncbi:MULTISPECIES: DUF1428 family protein [unclassified Devosia]|uniref:DUF1428 domain-containing protein n=1 Tax=unclassified Devosia TaxID=196773 RepID=UPI000FD99CD5|nr:MULTISPECIES: DUF1428 family protein [unclassified Devosia]
MPYVDGYVLAVPKSFLEQYKEIARRAGEAWMAYGALAYKEAVADDVPYGELTSFPRAVMATEDEVVIFSWVLYQSREQRDAVNAKVMNDPELTGLMENAPIDMKRMIFGGFTTFVDL